MFKEAGMLFLFTETPLHAGSGTSVGAVDLPIQRERHTLYPMIQASGVKGAMRDLAEHHRGLPQMRTKMKELERKGKELTTEEQKEKETLKQKIGACTRPLDIVFGPESAQHGGALSFTDARILLFPVRSLAGVFAWITCPTALQRFKRDLQRLTLTSRNGQTAQIPDGDDITADFYPMDSSRCFVAEPCAVESKYTADKATKDQVGMIVLEDFALTADKTQEKRVNKLGGWLAKYALPTGGDTYKFWKERLAKTLVIVHDDVFRDFVQFSTEVISRIRIDETGTVAEGALWSEEHLPSDTLLYTLALATDPKVSDSKYPDASAVLQFLQEELTKPTVLQLGGDSTVGRGIVQATLLQAVAAPPTQGGQQPKEKKEQ
jgi:CRISPR-associated protein Cmr4